MMIMTLDGWNEIQTHMEVITGITRSVRTLQRWSTLPEDPLPVRLTPGGRDVTADSEVLEGWWKRKQKGGGISTESPDVG